MRIHRSCVRGLRSGTIKLTPIEHDAPVAIRLPG
nr:MAG TPA: hypothetical protein [Caudoviricetes sp.]